MESVRIARRIAQPAAGGPVASIWGSQAKTRPILVEAVAEVEAAIRSHAKDGDVVMTMGAGSIGNVPAQLAAGQR